MTEPTNDGPPRAMYEHCCSVYDAMLKGAEKETEAVADENGERGYTGNWVYEGHLTRLFQDLGIAAPYYSQVRDLLIKMGCVEQLRRGGGNARSRWRLVQQPTEELFAAADAMTKRPQGRVAALEQAQQQLLKRVARLEEALGIPSGV